MATRSASTREAVLFGGRKEGRIDPYLQLASSLTSIPKENIFSTYRMPTIREIATFMSYPITYQFEGNSESSKYKLIGNSVCPKMSQSLAKAILLKERIKPPSKFIHLPKVRPTLDLTGRKFKVRTPKPKRPDARFQLHIPFLKIHGFRVELTNVLSDFKKDRVQWSCVLHHGSGKAAQSYEIDQNKLVGLFESRSIEGFSKFRTDLDRKFLYQLPNPKRFQKIYCGLIKPDQIGPEDSLFIIWDTIDRHFPEDRYLTAMIIGSGPVLGVMTKEDIPLRILLAVYACNRVAELVNTHNK